MNIPTPTEAHLDLVESVRYSNDRSAALQIADSEARAVAATVSSLTCTHHNDQQRAECPVCLVVALTAERDHWQKIAVSASQEREHNANVAQAMTAERDQLRAEVERLKRMSAEQRTAHEATMGLLEDANYNRDRIANQLCRIANELGQKGARK